MAERNSENDTPVKRDWLKSSDRTLITSIITLKSFFEKYGIHIPFNEEHFQAGFQEVHRRRGVESIKNVRFVVRDGYIVAYLPKKK